MTAREAALLEAVRRARADLGAALQAGDRGEIWRAALRLSYSWGSYLECSSYEPAGMAEGVAATLERARLALLEGSR